MTQNIPPESNDPFLDAVRMAAGKPVVRASEEEVDVAVRDLANRFGEDSSTRVKAEPTKGISSNLGRSLRGWVGYAAAALAIVTIGFQLIQTRNTESNASANHTYATGPGQRATITLKDGTRITLNVASRLHVPEDYGKRSRNVTLEGEAQFVVEHDITRPFTVQTHRAVVRDLATTFIIRAYGADDATTIAVQDGRVSVEPSTLSKTNAVTLDAFQVTTVHTGTIPQASIVQDIDSYFSWTRGKLILREVPLGDALATLSRWYGLEFRAADSLLLNSRVDAVLPERFDRSQAVDIADAIGARVTFVGKVITFSLP